MRLRRSRDFKVKMGDYEQYTFGATAEYSHFDLGFNDEEWAALDTKTRTGYIEQIRDMVISELMDQLLGEIEDSAELTRNQKSFIKRALNGESEWQQQDDGQRDGPRRLQRPRRDVPAARRTTRKTTTRKRPPAAR